MMLPASTLSISCSLTSTRRRAALNIALTMYILLFGCGLASGQCTFYIPNASTFPFYYAGTLLLSGTVTAPNGTITPFSSTQPTTYSVVSPYNFAYVLGANRNSPFTVCPGHPLFSGSGTDTVYPSAQNNFYTNTVSVQAASGTLTTVASGFTTHPPSDGRTYTLFSAQYSYTIVYSVETGTFTLTEQDQSTSSYCCDPYGEFVNSEESASANVSGAWPVFTATGPFAYVPAFGANAVSVFDLSTNLPVTTIPVGAGPANAAVSPDGTFVYVSNWNGGSISVISSPSDTVVATIPVGPQPWGIALTPDGNTVYVAVGGSNSLSVINTATQSVVATVPVGVSPSFVTVTPDGKYVYVSNGGSNSLSVINVATKAVVTTIPVGAAPQSVAVSPDGKTAYVVCPGSNEVSVVDVATNTLATSISVPYGPYGISISADGSTAYVAEYYGNATAVLDLATNTLTRTVPVGINPRGSALTPDGAFVWQTNLGSGFVSVISTATNGVVASVPVPDGVYDVGIGAAPLTPQSIAGTPGSADCTGKSISTLSQNYGGIAHAAQALGYASASAFQGAIANYCSN